MRGGLENIPGVVFINPQDDVDFVVGQISACERILSSSLHGLIVAHSFNIPWVRLRFSDHELGGGDFKFRDFYESIGCFSPNEITASINSLSNGFSSLILESYKFPSNDFSGLLRQQILMESAFYRSKYFNSVLLPLL